MQKQMWMSAVPHLHCLGGISIALVITFTCLTSGRTYSANKTFADHNVVSTNAGVLVELQEEKPRMTREELLGSNYRQDLRYFCCNTI